MDSEVKTFHIMFLWEFVISLDFNISHIKPSEIDNHYRIENIIYSCLQCSTNYASQLVKVLSKILINDISSNSSQRYQFCVLSINYFVTKCKLHLHRINSKLQNNVCKK